MMDQRGNSDSTRNNIYFKSEVVVREKDHGWVMWSGLSATKGNPSLIHMEYRLLLFKKTGGNWDIDKGFGWIAPKPKNTESHVQITSAVLDQFYVATPAGK